jgi:hypothetical protein
MIMFMEPTLRLTGMVLNWSVFAAVCFALCGCESPPVHIPPTLGTWTGNAFEVRLLGDKHPMRDKPKVQGSEQLRFMETERGEVMSWNYLVGAVTLEWGRSLTAKAPLTRSEYEPGQIGDLEGMVVLVDERGYPFDPAPYRNRSLRVSGKLMAGMPRCALDNGQLRACYNPVLPFSVMMWCLETSRGQIQDLGPVAAGAHPYFPPSVVDPERVFKAR